MLTQYVTTRPEAPAFVGQIRQHLKAAQALDNTVSDLDRSQGNVKVQNDQIDLSLNVDPSGAVQSFLWRHRPDQESEAELFSIRRDDKVEVLSHSVTTPSEWDFASLLEETERAGFSLTDGGLLWIDNSSSVLAP